MEDEGKIMEIVKDSAQVKQMLMDRTKLYEDCEQLSGTDCTTCSFIDKGIIL